MKITSVIIDVYRIEVGKMKTTNDLDSQLMMNAFMDAPVGILFMKDLKIININKHALEIMNYDSKEELIGKDPSVLSPLYQPDGRSSKECAEENFNKAIKEGMNQFNWVHMTKNGENKWFQVTLKRMRSDDLIFIAYWKEITKAVKFENRFTNFMKHVPAAVYIKDENLQYKYMNEHTREMLNLDKEFTLENTNFTVDNVLNNDAANEVYKEDQHVLRTGQSRESQLKYSFKDGEEKIFRNIKFLFEDVDYEKYIGGIFLDITDLTKATSRNKNLIESLITTIQKITEARDPYTSGHESRVSEIAVEIGKRLGLNDNQLEGLRIGALIHDVGKIRVPLEILNKPGRINENEFNLVKDHAIVGAELVSSVEVEWPIKEMIRQHHEKMDGSGYPDGLKGDQIIIEARIICVADVLEAMSSHRPYRPAKSLDDAIRELKRGSGIIYDQQVVDICIDLIHKEIICKK